MVDQTKKGIDYPGLGENRSNKDDQKQTQGFQYTQAEKSAASDRKENAYGGKLQQRESDVRDIVDNQIAGSPSYDNTKKKVSIPDTNKK